MVKIKGISDIINFILLVITFIIALFLIHALILKISGHSPDNTVVISWFLAIIAAVQVFNLKVLFDLQKTVYKHLGEHRGYRIAKNNQQKT